MSFHYAPTMQGGSYLKCRSVESVAGTSHIIDQMTGQEHQNLQGSVREQIGKRTEEKLMVYSQLSQEFSTATLDWHRQPTITTTKRSVVGSGPICAPG